MACPAAAMTMSASWMIFSGYLVREWTIVTVASAFKRRSETGNPMILLRPTTTALLPFTAIPLRESSSRQPCHEDLSINHTILAVLSGTVAFRKRLCKESFMLYLQQVQLASDRQLP